MRRIRIYFYLLFFTFLFTVGCTNKTGDISNYKAKIYKGASIEIVATSKFLSYTIRSDEIQINFNEYPSDMKLEKFIDINWYRIPMKEGTYTGMAHMASPESDYTNTIEWRDYYKYDMDKGKYRIIFTYNVSGQSDKYNLVSEFVIE